MENSGVFIYTSLIEVDATTGEPTGRTKPNIPSDPNYISPTTDHESCPLED